MTNISLNRQQFCFILITLLIGCETNEVSNKEVEKTIENVLNIDIPSDFKLIKEDVNVAFGGDHYIIYIVEYNLESFNNLLKIIPLDSSKIWDGENYWVDSWINWEDDHYSYMVRNDDRSSETISLLIKENQIKYLYYKD